MAYSNVTFYFYFKCCVWWCLPTKCVISTFYLASKADSCLGPPRKWASDPFADIFSSNFDLGQTEAHIIFCVHGGSRTWRRNFVTKCNKTLQFYNFKVNWKFYFIANNFRWYYRRFCKSRSQKQIEFKFPTIRLFLFNFIHVNKSVIDSWICNFDFHIWATGCKRTCEVIRFSCGWHVWNFILLVQMFYESN